MTKKDIDQASSVARPGLSEEGRQAARAKSPQERRERQAAALRENLLKRKHQQRSRRQPQVPRPPEI